MPIAVIRMKEQRDVQKTKNDLVKYVTKIKVWLLPCVLPGGVKAWLSPASYGGRLVRCCLYAIKYRWLYLLVFKLECVRQRGLGIFVSTPKFEHTCNFLSRYLQYNNLKYASSYAVSRPSQKKNNCVLMWRFWLVLRMNDWSLTYKMPHKVKILEKTTDNTWTEMDSSLT